MIPSVLFMAIHNTPTESVFTIRMRYSLTPGSTEMIESEIITTKFPNGLSEDIYRTNY